MSLSAQHITNAVVPSSTHYMDSVSADSVFAGFKAGFASKGTHIRRGVVEVPLSAIDEHVVSVTIDLKLQILQAVSADVDINRLLPSVVSAEVTHNSYKSSTAWPGSAGAGTSGTDYDGTTTVTYTPPAVTDGTVTIPTSVNLVKQFQDAKDAGDSSIFLRFKSTDETQSTSHTYYDETAAAADQPVFTIVSTPNAYGGDWIETEEVVGRVHDTKADVILQLGSRSFVLNDEVRLSYGTDPNLVGASTTVGATLNTLAAGDLKNVSMTGLSADTQNYYRVEFSADGGTSWPVLGRIRPFVTLPTPGSTVVVQGRKTVSIADEHRLRQHQLSGTSVLAVQDATAVNVAAESPIAIVHGGDVSNTKFSGASLGFPLEQDGSGNAVAVPTKAYALTRTDCDEAYRFYRNSTEMPYYSSFLFHGWGNHEGPHLFHRAENNSESNDCARWTLDAAAERFGLPTSLPLSPTTGDCYWTSAEAQARGEYYAVEIGDSVVCVMNAYLHTTASAGVNSPIQQSPSVVSDWKLGTEQFDFFFHTTTGVIATTGKKNVRLVIHNKTGGIKVGPPARYGRGGASYAKQETVTDGIDYTVGADKSEWITVVHPRLVALKTQTGKNISVEEGHDHAHQFKSVEGIEYIKMMAAGDPTGSEKPYGDGFAKGTARMDSVTFPGAFGFSPNAGYYVWEPSPSSMRITAKRTYVAGLGVSDPSDGIVTNGATVEAITISSAVTGRSAGMTRGRNLTRGRFV